MKLQNGFIAYSANPPGIGETIERAVSTCLQRASAPRVKSWRFLETFGHFISDQVLAEIETQDVLIADITHLNFNVLYEIGFAIGKRKPIGIIRNRTLNVEELNIAELGIFDTIGYETYDNADDLLKLFLSKHDYSALDIPLGRNSRSPIYLVESKYKTDFVNRLISRIKKSRLFYRTFDPNEQPRLAAYDAIENVAKSYGVVVPLLSPEIQDARIHNLRAAFVAGLAEGMERIRLVIQYGDSPVPLDFRDLCRSCYTQERVDEEIANFAAEVAEQLQSYADDREKPPENLLQVVNLGASTAENELRDLASYYLETDAYQRTARGEARLVVGRKGSGKTAIFYRVRDRARKNRNNVVVDLKPEGYQLLKFKESVLQLMKRGTQEHTIMAFWEYLLLLEICSKLLEADRERHMRDPNLYAPYRHLADKFQSDAFVSEGDFSERLASLTEDIAANYQRKYGGSEDITLSKPEITALLYRHDVGDLREELRTYLENKGELWLLFDNLDKGWPTHGLTSSDLMIVRTLIEATRKIERDLDKHEIPAHTIIFLRNDVHDLLLEETPDRGKEARVTVDWLDADLLREVIRLRIVRNGLSAQADFRSTWATICVSFIAGEDSSQYLIDRCLMRPRALINLINHCRGVAINLRKPKIEESDFLKGLEVFSNELLTEIALEIRDVMPEAENVLYQFIGTKSALGQDELKALILQDKQFEKSLPRLLDVLFWHGVLGLVWLDGRVEYIYHAKYNVRLFRAQIAKAMEQGAKFQINPAFWPVLGIS